MIILIFLQKIFSFEKSLNFKNPLILLKKFPPLVSSLKDSHEEEFKKYFIALFDDEIRSVLKGHEKCDIFVKNFFSSPKKKHKRNFIICLTAGCPAFSFFWPGLLINWFHLTFYTRKLWIQFHYTSPRAMTLEGYFILSFTRKSRKMKTN